MEVINYRCYNNQVCACEEPIESRGLLNTWPSIWSSQFLRFRKGVVQRMPQVNISLREIYMSCLSLTSGGQKWLSTPEFFFTTWIFPGWRYIRFNGIQTYSIHPTKQIKGLLKAGWQSPIQLHPSNQMLPKVTVVVQ